MQKANYTIEDIILDQNESTVSKIASNSKSKDQMFTCKIIDKSRLTAVEMIKLRKYLQN